MINKIKRKIKNLFSGSKEIVITDNGYNNKIIYPNGKINLNKYRITINGSNNSISINEIIGNGMLFIEINGNNNIFTIGKNNIVNQSINIFYWGTNSLAANNAKIIIGNSNNFNGGNIKIISPINTKILIGNNNLFAGNIEIWGRNDHIIYEKTSKKRLNYDKDIILGNEIWVGEHVKILPGTVIKNNTVIAMGTIVNKKFEKSNILIAGIPGKEKKENINWSIASAMEKVNYKNSILVKKEK